MSEQLAQVIISREYPGGYYGLRIAAPQLAQRVKPGQALIINGERWPVLRSDLRQGQVDCLAQQHPPAIGERVTLRGPQGGAFDLSRTSPRALLLGQLDSLAELLFLADQLRQQPNRIKLLLLLEAHGELPFQPQPSRIIVPDLPSWVIAALPLCEDWGIPSRIARADAAGCYDGSVSALAEQWLNVQQGAADVTVYACGGVRLCADAAELAQQQRLACQTLLLD